MHLGALYHYRNIKKKKNNLYGIKGAIKIYVVPNITKDY